MVQRTQISWLQNGSVGRHRNAKNGPLMNISLFSGFEGSNHAKTCQFIEGESKGQMSKLPMCGKPGFPWCPEHHSICYRPADEIAAKEIKQAQKYFKAVDKFLRAGERKRAA